MIVTTERPTEQQILSHSPSNMPEYEVEEQLLYKLSENKSTVNVVEHTTRINYVDEDLAPPLPELPYGPIELYKPRANKTKIATVPNEFKYYKVGKFDGSSPLKSSQHKEQFYNKDIENDNEGNLIDLFGKIANKNI